MNRLPSALLRPWIHLALAFAPCTLGAQEPPDTLELRGRVLDSRSGEPVAGAHVVLRAAGPAVLAEADGSFVLVVPAGGDLPLRISRIGYAPRDTTIPLSIVRTGVVRILLEPRPIALPAITVRTERRSRGGGAVERRLFEREISPGAVGVSGATLKDVPSLAEPDIVRGLQALPGVTARNALSAALHVEGGASDQNAYLLDGARVFGPHHMFGMVGTFNPEATGRVEMFKGALPARYGGALSSVIDVQHLIPDEGGLAAEGGLGLLGARATVRGGLGDVGRFLLAGRRSHADLVAEPLFKKDFPYAFHDVQGNVTIFPASGHSLAASFLTSRDRFRMFFAGAGDVRSRWGNRVGSLRWQWSGAGSVSVATTAWGSRYRGTLIVGDGDAAPETASRLAVGGLRVDVVWRGEEGGLRAGLDIETTRSELKGSESPGSFLHGALDGSNVLPAAYVEGERWLGAVRLAPALRVAYDSRGAEWLLSPRLAARLHIDDDFAVTVGVGRTHQLLSTLQDDRMPLPGAPLWFLHPEGSPTSTSDGIHAAVDRWFGEEWSLNATAYARRLSDVVRFRPVRDRSLAELAFDDGKALGLEVSARRHEGTITGWLGYGFARTRLTEEPQGIDYDAAWDRRHSLDAALFVRTWRTLTLSSRVIYGTGSPFWPFLGKVGIVRLSGTEGAVTRRDFVEVWGTDQMRFPDYFRLDASVRYRTHLLGLEVDPYLSVLNLTRRPNVIFYRSGFQVGDPSAHDPPGEGVDAAMRPVSELPFAISFSLGMDVRVR